MENKIIETVMASATVYKNGARIARTGTVTVPAGTSMVIVNKLPDDVDPSSVKVMGRSRIAGKIASVSIESYHEKEVAASEIQALEDQLSSLSREAVVLDRKIELASTRISSVMETRGIVLSSTPFPLPADGGKALEHVTLHGTIPASPGGAITALDEDISVHVQDLVAGKQGLVDMLDAVREKLGVAQNRLASARSGNVSLPFKQATITIEASEAGDFSLLVDYVVSKASWVPVYDIQLDEDAGKVSVAIIAAITNATTEPWDSVDLVASSADLQPVSVIEPQPWVLRERSRMPSRPMATVLMASVMAKRKSEAPREIREEKVLCEPAPMVQPEASVGGSKGSVVTFTLPSKVSVSNGPWKNNIKLVSMSLGAKVEYFYSAIDNVIIVQNRVQNGDVELLPGRARVFAGDDLVGETTIEQVLPGEEFVLGTRETYDLKIEKKLVSRSTEKAGMAKGKIERSYAYTITVENLAGKARELVMWDRIPHSDTELVKVTVTTMDPKPAETRMGLHRWQLTLGSLPARFTLNYAFMISYDKDVILDTALP